MISTANNHYIPENYKTVCGYWLSILEKHPLHTAFTKTAKVARIHLESLYKTIVFIEETPQTEDGEKEEAHFEFRLWGSNATSTIDLKVFRSLLDLPDESNYQPFPTTTEMLEAIRNLGYEGPLGSMQEFMKNKLDARWYIIYSLFNRCFLMTPRGTDSITNVMLRAFYSFVMGRRVDYGKLLWDMVQQQVEKPKSEKYIPCERFFSIIIDYELTIFKERDIPVPNSEGHQMVILSKVKYALPKRPVTAQSVRVPDYLLRLVPNNDERIRGYYVEIGDLQAPVQPPTREPTQRSTRVSDEGSSARGYLKRKKDDNRQPIRVRPIRAQQIIDEPESPEQPPKKTKKHVDFKTPEAAQPSSKTSTPICPNPLNLAYDITDSESEPENLEDKPDKRFGTGGFETKSDVARTITKDKPSRTSGRKKQVAQKKGVSGGKSLQIEVEKGVKSPKKVTSKDAKSSQQGVKSCTKTLLSDLGQRSSSRTDEGSPKNLEKASCISAGNRLVLQANVYDCDQYLNATTSRGDQTHESQVIVGILLELAKNTDNPHIETDRNIASLESRETIITDAVGLTPQYETSTQRSIPSRLTHEYEICTKCPIPTKLTPENETCTNSPITASLTPPDATGTNCSSPPSPPHVTQSPLQTQTPNLLQTEPSTSQTIRDKLASQLTYQELEALYLARTLELQNLDELREGGLLIIQKAHKRYPNTSCKPITRTILNEHS